MAHGPCVGISIQAKFLTEAQLGRQIQTRNSDGKLVRFVRAQLTTPKPLDFPDDPPDLRPDEDDDEVCLSSGYGEKQKIRRNENMGWQSY